MSTLAQPANSPSCFSPKISVGGADVTTEQPNHAALVSSVATAVNLAGTLTVAPEDVGKPADILMVGMYSTLAGELGKANWEWPLGEHFVPQLTGALYTRAGETWIFWDGLLSSLPSAEKVSQLPETLKVPVFEGDLSAAPGEFFAYQKSNFSLGIRSPNFSLGVGVQTTNELDRLMAVNCGPSAIMAQGISTNGPIETSFNCS